MGRRLDDDELIERWTLVGQELEQVAGKRGPSRLGFALLLRFHTLHGRFPRGRHELPDEAIAYVATLVKVPAADLGFYEWQGRTWEYHRAQIRTFRGFRECTIADADKLTAWLAEYVCQSERRPERVREQLLGQLSTERIEPPTPARVTRIIGSALRTAEQALTSRVTAQIPAAVAARMHALIAEASDDPADPDTKTGVGADVEAGELEGREVFAQIRADPGNVSLKTCGSGTITPLWPGGPLPRRTRSFAAYGSHLHDTPTPIDPSDETEEVALIEISADCGAVRLETLTAQIILEAPRAAPRGSRKGGARDLALSQELEGATAVAPSGFAIPIETVMTRRSTVLKRRLASASEAAVRSTRLARSSIETAETPARPDEGDPSV